MLEHVNAGGVRRARLACVVAPGEIRCECAHIDRVDPEELEGALHVQLGEQDVNLGEGRLPPDHHALGFGRAPLLLGGLIDPSL
eukprot:11513417-Alexandrium_andersonii.AAC.1